MGRTDYPKSYRSIRFEAVLSRHKLELTLISWHNAPSNWWPKCRIDRLAHHSASRDLPGPVTADRDSNRVNLPRTAEGRTDLMIHDDHPVRYAPSVLAECLVPRVAWFFTWLDWPTFAPAISIRRFGGSTMHNVMLDGRATRSCIRPWRWPITV